MSFSSEVKDELFREVKPARHCQIAELAAIFSMCGNIRISENDTYIIKIVTENVLVARKFYTLLKEAFDINGEVAIGTAKHPGKNNNYTVIVRKNDYAVKLLKAFKIMDDSMKLSEDMMVGNLVFQQACCKRAFIRGAFLVAGSISDPNKFYHFEIVCSSEAKANQLKEMINTFEVDSKVVMRKKSYVVYIKEGAQLVEILNVMEAHVALMSLENVRILKDFRNKINRKVNCETANLNKTVAAAVKQIKDIEYIRDTVGLGRLKEELEEMAKVRLENPDIPLKDLGQLLSQPVGKSGVNHRLKKISEIADSLRNDKEEQL